MKRVVTCRKSDSVVEAAQLMRQQHVGDVVVVEERGGLIYPVGIVTDRDITLNAVAAAPEQLPSLRVEQIIQSELVTVEEDEDLIDVLRQMRSWGIRRVPVVDDRGVLSGIVSFDDLIEHFAEEMMDLATLLARERKQERSRAVGSQSSTVSRG